MDPIAPVAQLLGQPGLELDRNDPAAMAGALRVLERASDDIVAELGWDPRESVRTYVVDPTWDGARVLPFYLPALYVSAVAVAVSGVPVDPAVVSWTITGRVQFYRANRTAYAIMYTAGWPPETMPSAIVSACVERALELLDNPKRLRSWQAGSASETYAATATAGAPSPKLDPYRLPPGVV